MHIKYHFKSSHNMCQKDTPSIFRTLLFIFSSVLVFAPAKPSYSYESMKVHIMNDDVEIAIYSFELDTFLSTFCVLEIQMEVGCVAAKDGA